MRRKPVLTRLPERVSSPPAAAGADEQADEDPPVDGNVFADWDPDLDTSRPARVRAVRAEVLFEVMGRQIVVGDGDTIGADIRAAMIEAGAPEDDAVLVHREHARIAVEDGLVFIELTSENSLRVNDRLVDEDERVRITHGDRVEFADVVTATVHLDDSFDAEPPVADQPVAVDRLDAGLGGAEGVGMQHSLTILLNTIPGEVLVLWAGLDGAADLYNLPVWASVVFLGLVVIATPVYVYRSIDDPGESDGSDWTVLWWQEANVRWQSISATGAFLVWVYYLGGPFEAAGLQYPALATVIVIVYPVLMVISPYYGSLILYQLSNLTPGENRRSGVR